MKVAYLVNQYPKISHTFIRREIEGLEAQGCTVSRYSLRRTAEPLVTPSDQAEAARTTVILERGVFGLLASFLATFVSRPAQFFRALALTIRVGRRSERGLVVAFIYLAEACVLLRCLQREGVRHIHAHFGTNPAAVAMLCNALGGPTYSFTIHGADEIDKPLLLHLREKIERAAFVVAVCSFGRSQVYRHCGLAHWAKVHVVHCGVDSNFLDDAPAPLPPTPRLVSIGRLTEQKGQLLLLDALGELHQRGREFHLTLVGDGEMRLEVEAAIARHGLGGKVTLLGWADEKTVRETIRNSRAMVLPSFAEGLPVVIMEALALGRPVLSTYIAGIPELVQPGKNGWLVPAGSVEALVKGLEQVLAAPPEMLVALGAHGRARVQARHDIGKITAQLADLMRGWA
jgi:colanic acid/amylovoran biosynthesis glycosyltransferase